MTDEPLPRTLSPWPFKRVLQLLALAVIRLRALGDDEWADYIEAHLPPPKTKGDPR